MTTSTVTEPRRSLACQEAQHRYCSGWLLGNVLCACHCHRAPELVPA